MTDEEIEKALECCGDDKRKCCKECPLFESGTDCVNGLLEKQALNYIKRLKAAREFYKAEIERIRHNWEISKVVQRTKNRKATAKEIIRLIKEHDYSAIYDDEILEYAHIIKEIAEKYGVEVE